MVIGEVDHSRADLLLFLHALALFLYRRRTHDRMISLRGGSLCLSLPVVVFRARSCPRFGSCPRLRALSHSPEGERGTHMPV